MSKEVVDTGARPPVKGITAWNKLSPSDVELQAKHINIVAVIWNSFTNYGFVESVAFVIAGIDMKTPWILLQDLSQ